MPSHKTSFLIQGDIRQETPQAIRSVRELHPEAEIVLSTWKNSPKIAEMDLCTRIIYSEDPGPICDDGYMRNLGRQIVSTYNGLNACTGEFSVKMRTDLILLKPFAPEKDASEKIFVWRNFSASPLKSRLLFHPSDMLQYGKTQALREYWNINKIPRPPIPKILPEQYLCLSFLESKGIINEVTEQRVLPTMNNLRIYTKAFNSFFQIIPRDQALLPERLRVHDHNGQLDYNLSGSIPESLLIWTYWQLQSVKNIAYLIRQKWR